MTTRVIVCGGRDFDDGQLLEESLDKILADYSNVEIVTGGAKGADTLGNNYAISHEILHTVMPANWTLGKNAGFVRNAKMLQYAQEEMPVVIAFWDGKSRGTKHMIDIAIKGGAKAHIVRY